MSALPHQQLLVSAPTKLFCEYGRKIIFCVAFFTSSAKFPRYPFTKFSCTKFSYFGSVGSVSAWQTRGHGFEHVLMRYIFSGKYPGI